jgi:hypothetical protein
MYNKDYYLKNREKLLEYQKNWNKKHYKSHGSLENKERAKKALETRRRNGI